MSYEKKSSQFPFEIGIVSYIVRQKTEIIYAFLVEGVATLRGSTMPWPGEKRNYLFLTDLGV